MIYLQTINQMQEDRLALKRLTQHNDLVIYSSSTQVNQVDVQFSFRKKV